MKRFRNNYPHREKRGFLGPKRVVPPVPALDELPHIDAVVIAHNHYDHLDQDSVAKLAAQTRGVEDVVELDWWEKLDFKELELHFVPVQHWSKRTLTDENQSLWGGWVIRHPELSFFFAGDSGYSGDFADIRAKFGGFDLAAIPIGAYAPPLRLAQERKNAGLADGDFFVMRHGETRTLAPVRR